MKKIAKILISFCFVAFVIMSCTKEEVKPQSGGNSTGGGVSSPMF
jgi:hypothetical protein